MIYTFIPTTEELSDNEKELLGLLYFYEQVDKILNNTDKPDGMSHAEFRDTTILRLHQKEKNSIATVPINFDLLEKIRKSKESHRLSSLDPEVREVPDNLR